VDAHGTLLGVVSEAGLLCRQEHQDDEDGAGPAYSRGTGPASLAQGFPPDGGDDLTGADGSRRGVPAECGASACSGQGRRLFVIDCEQLVGVVARRDLLRAFFRSNEDIQGEINQDRTCAPCAPNKNDVRATVEPAWSC
jgi:hypothetical protein